MPKQPTPPERPAALSFSRGAVARAEAAGRRQAEESLRRIEEHFDALVANVRDYAIFLLDAGGHVMSWNAGAERIKGYKPADILGEHFSRFYPREQVERGWPDYELQEAARVGHFEDEGWRLRKDGSRFWANVVITALIGPQGEVRGFLKITRDLTERKMGEEALRTSEERFRLMVDSVTEYAIFMLDPQGRVATWNAGAERLKGYTADEIVGRHFSVFYPPETVATGWPEEELRRAETDGRVEDEGWRVRKDGSRFWANVVITALRDASGELRGFAKVTRDLTERRAAEESLRAAHVALEHRVEERTRELVVANQALRDEIERRRILDAERERLAGLLQQRVAELAAADRHKNEFLAMLGHELRNPLAPIRNALEILRNEAAPPPMLEQARGMIDRQVHHLVRLVDDLLDVSRIMQGKIDLRRERLDLGTVVARAIETAQPVIDAQGHQLLVHLPGEPVQLDGDLVRLSQVLSNLLVNAAKYTLQAGVIELSAEVEGERAVVRVRDNGIGIAPELLPRVFDFFVQGQRSLARSQGGLGIGLTLVRRLVEMHGGEVRADSAGPGLGSVFTVSLPLFAGRREPATEAPAAPAEAKPPCLRVLIVDDNVDAAESTAALLALWGYETRVAHDGNSVVPAVRSFRPDVVLLDIGLPGRNGFDVAADLRALPDSPVRLLAAMTGYGQEEDLRRSAQAGFDIHLVKPLDPGMLRETLDKLACG